ncbi:hypothetical protein LADH09A_004449 [Micromonospora sp. LAH09]|uniref:hypothetical protein n=1 Tax=Micromonospora cabrerizensis TaxID=2911213 RepID=UPI001EE87EF0|nr:hypothetical protein [Micromonospora cabrerizensis]MCG5470499.1 hypothetical protein [Micromonospora cabrerizensis]
MTGRRTEREHEDRHTGPAVGDDPGPEPASPRSAGVAPQPRVVPGGDPGSTSRPGPSPRPSPVPRPGEQQATPSGQAVTSSREEAGQRAATPVRPTPAAPTPTPARPTPAAPVPSPARPGAPGSPVGSAPAATEAVELEAVELEPTTGAPVDAVPRRVPVRQQGRLQREGRPDGDTPSDDGVFWAPIEEVHWDGTPVREDHGPSGDRGSRPVRRRAPSRTTPPPDPLPGLAALVTLSLVAAFFAWVSAGPFWLAVGHARVGTVVLDGCTGGGLTQRCRGTFTAEDGRFVAHGVRVSGVPAGENASGTPVPARMTGPDAGTAYADSGVGRHLRWLPGLLVVLACTAGIVRWTGSARLPGRRHRRWAVTAAIAGPVLITVGFLASAW